MSPKKFYAIIILTHIAITAVASVPMHLIADDASELYLILSLMWVAAVILGQLDMTEFERKVKMKRMLGGISNLDSLLYPSMVTGLIYLSYYHTGCHLLLFLFVLGAAVCTALSSSIAVAIIVKARRYKDDNDNDNENYDNKNT